MSDTQEATFPEYHAAVYVRSDPPLRRWLLGLAAAYVGIVALVYLPSFGAYFQADDFELINKVARFGPFGLWTTSHDHLGFLRPLISLSLYLDYRVWGNTAFGYHLTNLVA